MTCINVSCSCRACRVRKQPSDGEATEELVAEGLGLGDGAEAAVADLLGVELHSAVGEVESLLHHRRQLPDPATLLTEDALGAGGADDDLGPHGGDPDLDAREAVLPELAGEHLVQLGQEHAIRDASEPTTNEDSAGDLEGGVARTLVPSASC